MCRNSTLRPHHSSVLARICARSACTAFPDRRDQAQHRLRRRRPPCPAAQAPWVDGWGGKIGGVWWVSDAFEPQNRRAQQGVAWSAGVAGSLRGDAVRAMTEG